MSAGVEPASYAIAVLERSRFAGQVAEDALGHVLRQMNITMDLPQGRGIDEVHVPLDQFAEGVLGAVLDIASQHFAVGWHFQSKFAVGWHFQSTAPESVKTAQKNLHPGGE